MFEEGLHSNLKTKTRMFGYKESAKSVKAVYRTEKIVKMERDCAYFKKRNSGQSLSYNFSSDRQTKRSGFSGRQLRGATYPGSGQGFKNGQG